MKLPLSWLASHVDLPEEVDELVDLMTQHGLEVESVSRPGAGTAGVRTARVLEHRPHPDADQLRLVEVTGTDGEGTVEVVCGATNFDTGDVVVHAPPGSSIPGMTLEKRKIRGVTSNGMLCSPRELGLGDDHAGLIVLDDDIALGQELTALIPLGEPVIEIAVQADRGDHMGVFGVARDLSAIMDVPLREPDVPEVPAGRTLPVELATTSCARFVTWALDEVAIVASPLWLRHRLAQCGVRAIDVVVDVTNFVMLELGQPLHAFDLDRLRGNALTVRHARSGETITTLDGIERHLEAGDVVITDDDGPTSLAGVMGGSDSEVSPATRRVLVEAAVWEPKVIRSTSRRLGLVSEASMRYERRVDPAGADRAAARAAGLLASHAGGHITGADVADHAKAPRWAEPSRVTFSPVRVRRLLGVHDLDDATQRSLLERSGCTVERTKAEDTDSTTFVVTSPTWRGDLAREADLAEEVARLHGYDRIPAELPSNHVVGGLTPAQRLEREARQVALSHGFDEAVLRPFVGDDVLVGVVPSNGRVRLANPLAKDAAAMRPSLVEGLLGALRRNVGQGRAGTALVEIGRIFRPVTDPLAEALDAHGGDWRWHDPQGGELPVQPRTLGLAAHGIVVGDGWMDQDDEWSVFDLLAVMDAVVTRLSPPGAEARLLREPVEREGFHPGRSARLLLAGAELGFVGALHPEEARRRDLPEPVVVGELLLEPLLVRVPKDGHEPRRADPITRHPALTIDVAIVADETSPHADLEQIVRDGAGELLDAMWWFDEYRGAQVGEGRRSVAFRVRLQHPERQLTDADADRIIDTVAERASRAGAALRR